MQARDFCFWLQGFLEIEGTSDPGEPSKPFGLTTAQTDCVRRHLALVFVHEIDPTMGGADVQLKLNKVHAGPPNQPLMRC